MPKLFIDTHCHFFSAEHIPLSQSLDRIYASIVGNPLSHLLLGIGAVATAPVAGAFGKELLEKVMRFVRFFDRPGALNIQEAVTSIRRIRRYDMAARKVFLTPLVKRTFR